MKRFRFKLETLLTLRKRREDEVKLELGKKNREIHAAKMEMRNLHALLVELQSSEKEKRAGGGETALELRYSVAYRFKLKQDIILKGRQIDELAGQADAVRKRLIKATQARRAIEILRERKMDEWKKEYLSKEQGFVDDISQQAFIRRSGTAEASGT